MKTKEEKNVRTHKNINPNRAHKIIKKNTKFDWIFYCVSPLTMMEHENENIKNSRRARRERRRGERAAAAATMKKKTSEWKIK